MVNPMQDHAILQDRLPLLPLDGPPHPSLARHPAGRRSGLADQDEAYGPQMALRDRLIAAQDPAVHALLPEAERAAAELYGIILDRLASTPGFKITATSAQRPDGGEVPLDPAQPLRTLGRLVQEDLCLLQARGEEYRLTGAILCFPAS